MRKLAYIFSLLTIFTIPWEDAFTIGTLGSIVRVVGIVTAFFWLISVILKGKLRKPNFFLVCFFLFIVWNAISYFWSSNLEEYYSQILTYLQLGALAYIMWDLYTSLDQLRAAMKAYIFGAYVTILSTIINYINGREAYLYSGGRYAGAGLNAVDLALILSLGLPIAWYLATTQDKDRSHPAFKFIYFIFIPAALFAIILSGSRSSVFVTIPAFIFIVATFNRLSPIRRLFITIVFIGAILVIQFYTPTSIFDRLATVSSSIMSGDLGGRVRLWQTALATFVENPILGIGAGGLRSTTQLGTVVHNTFLSVLTELGLFGFLFFMAVLAILIRQIFTQPKLYARLWLTVFAIWIIGASTLTWEYRKPTWLLFSMIAISANILRQPVWNSRSEKVSESSAQADNDQVRGLISPPGSLAPFSSKRSR